jgi:hypothetical protein
MEPLGTNLPKALALQNLCPSEWVDSIATPGSLHRLTTASPLDEQTLQTMPRSRLVVAHQALADGFALHVVSDFGKHHAATRMVHRSRTGLDTPEYPTFWHFKLEQVANHRVRPSATAAQKASIARIIA